ncbi:MAG TPA: cytochrome P450 [Polyangiales bacterium]|nr:cytochrome P450 [Polyangiales bacterium]
MKIDEINFFKNSDVVADPFPYFEALRRECPVRREPHHNVMMVTGYEEALQVYNAPDSFSSCTSVTGPFPGFPVPLDGKSKPEIDALIAEHRHKLPMNDQLPTLDPPAHTASRALLMRLITPKRLAENEAFIYRLTDRTLDSLVARGSCEYNGEFAAPLAMLVVADLLGVPDEDRDTFRDVLLRKHGHGEHKATDMVGSADTKMSLNPLEFLYQRFSEYISERRANPRADVLTGLASAKFPDGSTPEVLDVVRVAANLFAAGQETTVRLLSSGMKILAENQALQERLRAEPGLLSNFVEETLRMESPVKGDFRLARCPVEIGGVDVPAGTTVMVLNGAANRDPRMFKEPDTFDLERANARQQMAFGRGIHSCPGAPLARAEARIGFQRLLARTRSIRISDAHHGPAGARRFQYVPTFILRGLTELHVEFEGA